METGDIIGLVFGILTIVLVLGLASYFLFKNKMPDVEENDYPYLPDYSKFRRKVVPNNSDKIPWTEFEVSDTPPEPEHFASDEPKLERVTKPTYVWTEPEYEG